MPGPIAILFGAALTIAVGWCFGREVIGRIAAPMSRMERELLSGVVGAALLSLLVFGCCALRVAARGAFASIAVVAFAMAVYTRKFVRHHATLNVPALSRSSALIFGAPYAVYAVLYLSNSLAPETSPDGMAYHLGLVYRYFRNAGFERFTTNMYEYLSKGVEMPYLFAFAFGGRPAAATVHCAFLLALPLLILSYARRIGKPWAGVCAAMLVYLSPVVGIDGVSAYTDVALACVAFSLFYTLEIWRGEQAPRAGNTLLPAIGLLAGFCFAIKLTGAVAILYAASVILLERKPRALVPVMAAAALIALPWPIRNWLWTGNPAAPFFNRIFPNPYIHASFESTYRHYFATYNLPEFHSLPWKLTVSGDLGGQIGPVFLLAPIALLSLRSREGRRCLLAAAFFLLTYPTNIGARFLIPALPFIALAMALALSFSNVLLATLIVSSAILAWPRVIRHYRAPTGTWQISTMPWQAALGIVPPERYLEQRSAEYRIATMLDANVPERKHIWSAIPVAESYEKPDVLVSYQSAEGELLEDILMTAIDTDRQPLWNLRFTFPPRRLKAIEFEQTAPAHDDIWSIGEVKLFLGEAESRPSISRVSASFFAWDAWLAIDSNPVTRWRSWDSIRPGMWWSAEFAKPVMLDRAELHCSHDQWAIAVRMLGVNAKAERLEDPHFGDLRRLSAQTVKKRGVDYLLTGPTSRLDTEFARNAAAWGITAVAQTDGAKLYRIK